MVERQDALSPLCRENLAGYKIPRSIVVVDMLPRGGTGRILKRQLRHEREAQQG